MVDLEGLAKECESEPPAVTVEVGARRGQHDHADGRVAVPDVLDQLEAGATGHDVVGQHEVVALLLEEPEPLGAARRQVGLAAPHGEQLGEKTADISLIVDDQDARRVEHGRGTVGRGARRDQYRTSPREMRYLSEQASDDRVRTRPREAHACESATLQRSQAASPATPRGAVPFLYNDLLGI